MNEYYKTELLLMVEKWPVGQIDTYIRELEKRLEDTREHIRALKAIKKRMGRNANLKDSGARGGK